MEDPKSCKSSDETLEERLERTCGTAKIRLYRSRHPNFRPCTPPESRPSRLRVCIEAFLERFASTFSHQIAFRSPKNVYSCVLLNKKHSKNTLQVSKIANSLIVRDFLVAKSTVKRGARCGTAAWMGCRVLAQVPIVMGIWCGVYFNG